MLNIMMDCNYYWKCEMFQHKSNQCKRRKTRFILTNMEYKDAASHYAFSVKLKQKKGNPYINSGFVHTLMCVMYACFLVSNVSGLPDVEERQEIYCSNIDIYMETVYYRIFRICVEIGLRFKTNNDLYIVVALRNSKYYFVKYF